MNAIALEWPDVQPPEADAADQAAEATPVLEEVTAPKHEPTFNYAEMPTSFRTSAVPEALRPFMVEATAEGYTPPFYVNRVGSTRSTRNPIPGCPPIEPGGKALVFDDWGNPRVITVTGIHDGEVRGMFGTIPLQCKAWIAMAEGAPLTEAPVTTKPGRLTDEEAEAVEAEIMEWSKFLGWRAEKYRWCTTFEAILNEMGVKPWRPGFKTVTLQVDVRIDDGDIDLAEKIGGASKVKTVMASTMITLEDVSREDYNAGRWVTLLKQAGYKNITDGSIYVHDKEVVAL